jgi:uncharacterized membrane protein YkvA (DUF1232 family)
MMNTDSPHDYARDFNEQSFWTKLKKFAGILGRELVEKTLTLYYAAQDKDTPLWARGVIFASLGYLIFPADAIPDIIPGVGYADDAGALAAAIGMVAMHIKPGHKESAKQKMRVWFSDEPDTESGDSSQR